MQQTRADLQTPFAEIITDDVEQRAARETAALEDLINTEHHAPAENGETSGPLDDRAAWDDIIRRLGPLERPDGEAAGQQGRVVG